MQAYIDFMSQGWTGGLHEFRDHNAAFGRFSSAFTRDAPEGARYLAKFNEGYTIIRGNGAGRVSASR